jgi:hypothetical protein
MSRAIAGPVRRSVRNVVKVGSGSAGYCIETLTTIRARRSSRKHPKNGIVELDNRSMHKRNCAYKTDYQRDDGQAIFELDSTRLVRNETGDKTFHRTRYF